MIENYNVIELLTDALNYDYDLINDIIQDIKDGQKDYLNGVKIWFYAGFTGYKSP